MKPTPAPSAESKQNNKVANVIGLVVAITCLVIAGVMITDQIRRDIGAASDEPSSDADTQRRQNRQVQLGDLLDRTFDLAGLSIERGQILHGGPGVDGIPSLTTTAARLDPNGPPTDPSIDGDHPPVIVPVDDAGFLEDDSRVVGVTISGNTRAYPIDVLNYHECVNDVLGGVPIAVTYCPLCDSVTVLGRRVGEGDDAVTLTLGISGYLYHSNVLLYDRQERGLWSQIGLEAISGPRVGTSLTHLPGWTLTRFAQFREQHPDADVLSFNTGFDHLYSANPYGDYADTEGLYFPVTGFDDRLNIKQRIIGVRYRDQTLAIVVAGEDRQTDHTFRDGSRLIVAQDTSGSVTITEQPEDAQLIHTFWYAWSATHPDTAILE